MPQADEITITIDPSLLEHFKENLDRQGNPLPPADAATLLLTNILGNSVYPISAKRTGERAIRIGYRLRSFSQPIFNG